MLVLGIHILKLYLQLGGLALLGFILGRLLPPKIPVYIGKFLFWIGVPVGVIAFVRRSDLSGSIWLAPAIAWVAILLGAGLSWIWLRSKTNPGSNSLETAQSSQWSHLPTQGSFVLSAMVGNTGFIGYPVTLALVGEQYFAWALFYDLLGTVIGAYGLGAILAARFGEGSKSYKQFIHAIVYNPTLWSLGLGLLVRDIPLPPLLENSLQRFAWSAIALSLILCGMRLSQLHSWRSLKPASVSLVIKMLIVPLFLGIILSFWGLDRPALLILVLQMAMPPAFATLVLAETYNLDRDLAVTALGLGSVCLLVTLPLWVLMFGIPTV
ncbi:AEC family transporter [Phormidium pseudopriestleyi FRX01]|uniref:AEC family transporter n=1 Tax=Phormidium pseudopriestleyi FRX01 TaxID=1759528 RepID=A0ABS3FW36_9CYAN|nr:AEC family transporter [Phormidium pseudopriestleyi]MBO0351077.1 AEC family transporter [Phormidium pseudopriestleyi FRX01]